MKSKSRVARFDLSMRVAAILLCACSSASDASPPSVTEPLAPAVPPTLVQSARPALPPIGDTNVTSKIVGARVVVAVDDGIATDRPAYARADQKVTLHAVLIAELAGKRVHYSDAKRVQLDGKSIAVLPLAKAPALELRWNRIEPAEKTMTNGDTPAQFRFEPIDYRATPIDATNRGTITADVRPTLTPDHGNGVGTMRYQIVALQAERVIASPGPEARRGRGSGGVTDAVTRVSIRRDDSYLGFLTEMYGQPYIWASAGITDRNHQSEHLEGSDCADFVVYGKRRMGGTQPYVWTGALPQHAKLLAAGDRATDGVYRDKAGKPLPFTRIGDLVLFPRHVGVLALDRGTIGVLDDQDVMMHTLFDSPKEVPIAESGYADKPVELRRWR
jgi:hypothetical protein